MCAASFHRKIRKIGKHYQKQRMFGNPRMPGKIVKVHGFCGPKRNGPRPAALGAEPFDAK
jgi:hypothetical protein